MTTRLQWHLLKVSRQLGMRAALFSALGVATALLGVLLDDVVPKEMAARIGVDAVDSLLGIISASMLSVTIFSLSTMVSAYSAATSNVTPRATRLLIEDSFAQNALATFVGAFLFSLVGIIALQSGLYNGEGRVVLYLATLVVIVFIVITLLRWIDHVSKLGRVGQTTDRVEEAATQALRNRLRQPYLGGTPREDNHEPPAGAHVVYPLRYGYVQHIDMAALSELCSENLRPIYIGSLPGCYADTSRPLAWVIGELDEEQTCAIRKAFSLSDERTFDQDPRFGVSVLAEIASRALSPAVNDPGTAIDVIGRGVRLLAIWAEPGTDAEPEIEFPHVHVPPVLANELFNDLFAPIARDGAAMVEVGVRLQKGLKTLSMLDTPGYKEAALEQSARALARAEKALTLDYDKEQLRAVAAEFISAD